jgi:hypothetical protein
LDEASFNCNANQSATQGLRSCIDRRELLLSPINLRQEAIQEFNQLALTLDLGDHGISIRSTLDLFKAGCWLPAPLRRLSSY